MVQGRQQAAEPHLVVDLTVVRLAVLEHPGDERLGKPTMPVFCELGLVKQTRLVDIQRSPIIVNNRDARHREPVGPLGIFGKVRKLELVELHEDIGLHQVLQTDPAVPVPVEEKAELAGGVHGIPIVETRSIVKVGGVGET